ncbi:hypothetical protein cand_010990 [Cryptosporidium andersoni]|uniref:Conserved oligomeric Golgi complex subunit 8 n=1 Tax=Cryptosporidium andersoni TaxID=117008 RepID=A0A1J4MTX3_9CRYT|nr:hypothetical protein cand_010990 [Cryptosporidium andersoni]
MIKGSSRGLVGVLLSCPNFYEKDAILDEEVVCGTELQQVTTTNNSTTKRPEEVEEVLTSEIIESDYYIISLLASGYPNVLLNEARYLDNEAIDNHKKLQITSLKNSSIIIKSNKECINDIKLNIDDLDSYVNIITTILYPKISESIGEMKESVCEHISVLSKLNKIKNSLQIIMDLIDLPNLINNLINANMMDEALNALEYGESSIKLVETYLIATSSSYSRNKSETSCSLLLLDTVYEKLQKMRELFYHTSKLKLIDSQLSLIQAVNIIGQLRRLMLSRHNILVLDNNVSPKQNPNESDTYKPVTSSPSDINYILANIFLECRGEYLNSEYAGKAMATISVNPYLALTTAMSLFSTPLLTVASVFDSIFPDQDLRRKTLIPWANKYTEWFAQLIKMALHFKLNDGVEKISTSSIEPKLVNSLTCKTIYSANLDLDELPLAASCCQAIYKQMYALFSSSGTVSSLILPLIETYMIEYIRKLLEFSIESFKFELKNFDWSIKNNYTVSSSILSSLSLSSLNLNNGINNHPNSIINYRPLAVLYNEFTHGMNELRQCPILSIQPFVVDLVRDFLSILINEINELFRRSTLYNSSINDNIKQPLFINIDNVLDFTKLFVYDFVPYVENCLNFTFDLSSDQNITKPNFESDEINQISYETNQNFHNIKLDLNSEKFITPLILKLNSFLKP